MSDIRLWSPTAASNNSASPDGAPEGWAPAEVNNLAREMMAAVRRQHEDADWIDWGHTTSFVTTATFKIQTDVTSIYEAGRRLRSDSGAGGVNYHDVLTSTFDASDTIITLDHDTTAGVLTSSLTRVAVGLLTQLGLTDPFGSQRDQIMEGYINGLTLSNDAGDTAHDIAVAAGVATRDDNSGYVALGASIIKRIDAVWAVGSAAGGLDTGVVAADTWYHMFLIQRSDTKVVDVLFSASFSAPTMPTNYDRKRRIGSVLTDPSDNILGFVQRENTFFWEVRTRDLLASITSDVDTAVALKVPSGPIVEAIANCRISHSGSVVAQAAFYNVGATVPSFSTGTYDLNTQATGVSQAELNRATNTSQQIRYAIMYAGVGSLSLTFGTVGWIDPRGRV